MKHADIAEQLLNAGADANFDGANMTTPLGWVCQNLQPAIVQQLLDAGAAAGRGRPDGVTPLTIVCSKGGKGEQCARMLLASAADVNAAAPGCGPTALIKASTNGHLNCVESLLGARASVDQKQHSGATALLIASENGR
eukprot:5079691-Prymnesium_polylepis.3